ncbi:MAG: hypothetical protein MMC33_002657 [Icmadophila ericetorum]|nr:hypothetical protein [Icmadophila ericetorum]
MATLSCDYEMEEATISVPAGNSTNPPTFPSRSSEIRVLPTSNQTRVYQPRGPQGPKIVSATLYTSLHPFRCHEQVHFRSPLQGDWVSAIGGSVVLHAQNYVRESSVDSSLGLVHKEIQAVKEEIKQVKGEFTGIKTEMGGIRNEFKGVIQELRSHTSSFNVLLGRKPVCGAT